MRSPGALLAGGIIALTSGYPGAQAAECQVLRGFAGAEGVGSFVSGSLWRFDTPAFRNNAMVNGYLSLVGRCSLGDTLSIKTQGNAAYTLQGRRPGALEDRQNQGVWLLNDLVASWQARENLYVDAGKIRKNSGYLFSSAPLDLLNNPLGNLRSARVFAQGDRWRNFYDEGAWGLDTTLYRTAGAFSLTAMPRLRRNNQWFRSAAQWDALRRTNHSDRYLASYTASGLNDFNPTVSLLLGSQKTLALGASGNLTDNLILNLEGSLSHGETWRHLDSIASRRIRQYQYVADPYRLHSRGIQGDLGIGLRYATADRREYGIEYYGQSQGYSRSEWRNHFDTLRFINGGYASALPAVSAAALQSGYQQYARQMAAGIDNTSRSGQLFGKHYLTLYFRTSREQVGSIDYAVSTITNLIDHSSVLSLHLSTPLKPNLEVYSGVSATFGSQESEFGTFGKKGNIYAGMRITW
ncbi:hypothetical protein [Entomohabitans teleogrylli]|uniref:hypothetical protein n=1 Tax=Entomohabitans teleogrylli TaxID=1384589 RepID=UPI00073D729A|nr:hypothetical protein [Entomohabitans teleogrylli]